MSAGHKVSRPVTTGDVYIDLHAFYSLWLTFPADTAVALTPPSSGDLSWSLADAFGKFIIRSRALILSQYGIFLQRVDPAQLWQPADHFPWLAPKARTHYRERLGRCIQRGEGPPSPSAEPYCARLSSSPSLNIRCPCHFIFLSCSMMNEVSGTRCFLESSSRIGGAKASIWQLQKWLCPSSALSCYNKQFLIVSSELFHGYTNGKRRKVFEAWREIQKLQKELSFEGCLCMKGTWGKQQGTVPSW